VWHKNAYESKITKLAEEGKLTITPTGKQASAYARAGIDFASAPPLLVMTHIGQEMHSARDLLEKNGDLTLCKEIIAKYLGAQEAKDFDAEYNAILHGPRQLSGTDAFFLYETFGLPKDFIQDACHDAGVKFDEAGLKLHGQRSKPVRGLREGWEPKVCQPCISRAAEDEFSWL